MHSDGLPNEPKRSHLSSLHRTLASLNGVLLSQPAQVHRAFALPVFDGQQFTTPRVFRSGLTACDWKSPLQLWSRSSAHVAAYPPQSSTLFLTDVLTNGSFCLTLSDDKQHVGVLPCDASRPPAQLWLVQQGKGPGMNVTISSVDSPGSCIGLDLDSNGNFLSSSLVLLSCDFFDSGLAVSWNFDLQSQLTEITSSISKSVCISAIETANVTAFTYGSHPDIATFVVNRNTDASAETLWGNTRYTVAAAATLILDSAGIVLFDSSNVSSAPIQRTYVVLFPHCIFVTLCPDIHPSWAPTC
jgi:hypothetical protein